jgi:hypothetical protein
MANFAHVHGVQGQQNVVAIKRSYRWEGRELIQLPEPPELVEAPQEENGILRMDTDSFPKISCSDLVVRGAAWARGGQPVRQMEAAVVVHGVSRVIRVFGARHLQRVRGQWQFSEPEPFESVPLDWSESYGGWDQRGAEAADPYQVKRISEAFGKDMSILSPARYRRNPHGKGFFQVLTGEHEGAALPRLEWAHDLLTPTRVEVPRPDLWYGQPSPACFEWVAYTSFPRSCFWGERLFPMHQDRAGTQKLPEYAFGLKPEDLLPRVEIAALAQHPRMFNGAHPALQLPSLKGKVQLEFQGMDPNAASLSFMVPTGAPEVTLNVPGDSKTYKGEGVLSTLFVDVAKRQVQATWHAVIRSKYPTFPDRAEKIRYEVRW